MSADVETSKDVVEEDRNRHESGESHKGWPRSTRTGSTASEGGTRTRHGSGWEGRDIIIIAADHSPFTEVAFDWYVNHMHKPNHRVIVAHCIEPPAVPSRDSWAELSQKERRRTKEIEDKYVDKMKHAGMSGKVYSDFGRPGEFLCELAQKENSAFIVIGTRGMGTLRRTIMGSVSDYVVHHASCPVVVCRNKP